MINAFGTQLIANVSRVMVGKDEVVRLALAAILAGGHVLLEDVPGTGKTILARALAASLGLSFRRSQFTPDLLPSDITGVSVYNGSRFEFMPGPIFTNLFLADEINRATPKTQSALLEAMAEGQVTADGQTHVLSDPFVVIATQNPVEMDGTYRLPEAQLDRFLVRLSVGYPNALEEVSVLERLQQQHPITGLAAVSTAEHLLEARRQVRQIRIEPELRAYIVALVQATRLLPEVHLGASPRASLALQSVAQALAGLAGRDFVLPDDIKRVASGVLEHRLIVRSEARLKGVTAASLVRGVLSSVAVPVEHPDGESVNS
jgi:MoxR-like ATPase